MGQNTFVVEEVGCGTEGGCGTIAHIADGGGYIFAYIFLCQRAVLHKLVHLHTMAECLVGNQTGNGGISNDIVYTGLDGFCQSQHMEFVEKLVCLAGQVSQDVAHQMGVGAFSGINGLIVLVVNDYQIAVYPDIMLGQFPVCSDEQLRNIQGADGAGGIADMFIFAQERSALLLAEGEQLVIGKLSQIIRTLEVLNQRFIAEGDGVDGVGQEGFVQLECFRQCLGQLCHVAGNVIHGILEEYAAAAHFDHETTFGIAAVGNAAGVAVSTDAFGFDIGTQNADIREILTQMLYQLFGSFSSGIKKF